MIDIIPSSIVQRREKAEFSRLLVVVASALFGFAGATTVAAPADATPCPDVEVVFARGTFEPPGVGATGQAFVDALTAKVANTTIDVYPVNYPASLDFATAAAGIIDAGNKVKDVAATCPHTEIVIGGYSQGAAVAAYLTEDSVPAGFSLPPGLTGPMPPSVADHVAAVVLFGKPSSGFMQMIYSGAPPITVGALYTGKTTDLCIPDDPVCVPGAGNFGAHNKYIADGLTDQAADFTSKKL
ncbi:cutinase family protein [Mycolicibacterium hodleri]|uniref:Cutinase n=1 Tax=Mycolicibacterium hodleri TaxID=49897 RepID=A0A502E9R3_9MYCO|nr:cutinase family protein [Mycolicibacterium hodleri]TPG34458.1 cutinase family protein [Mycolicibacterium hodleri]